MADEKLKVLIKSKELSKHTLIITSNPRRYPKKYRFSLVPRMQNTALEIYELLSDANDKDLRKPKEKEERIELQTIAIRRCKRLLDYIEFSHDLHIINIGSMEAWSKMVKDIKYMAIAWRTNDNKR